MHTGQIEQIGQTEQQVGDIVARDFRTAAVFQKHGIDFCCGGKQSLHDACEATGADETRVLAELGTVAAEREQEAPPYAAWSLPKLIEHILHTHHAYVRRTLPALRAWAEKVVSVHGQRHPELAVIAEHLEAVAGELTQHMIKEERILFPAIVRRTSGMEDPTSFGSIANPIRVMEQEHRNAGEQFDEIRRVSGGYALPEDACATYTAFYRELEAFEADLHVHIHLENNILFPRTLALEEGR